jgi:hypothetical protein
VPSGWTCSKSVGVSPALAPANSWAAGSRTASLAVIPKPTPSARRHGQYGSAAPPSRSSSSSRRGRSAPLAPGLVGGAMRAAVGPRRVQQRTARGNGGDGDVIKPHAVGVAGPTADQAAALERLAGERAAQSPREAARPRRARRRARCGSSGVDQARGPSSLRMSASEMIPTRWSPSVTRMRSSSCSAMSRRASSTS